MRYLLFLCAAVLMTSCATRIYQAAEIETIAEKHTTIAVVPARVDYSIERPMHRNWSFVPDKETIGKGTQAALIDWLNDRKKKGLLEDIKVQDVEITNELLANTTTTSLKELARELGVDAVLASRLRYDTRFDYARALYVSDFQFPSSRIHLNLLTPDKGLIWSYERGGFHVNNNYNRIVFDLLRNAENQIPYKVAK